MLFKKLWRTMGLYRAQFISMVIMIALGVGMFVGCNMEWVSIESNTSSFFENTGFADYRLVNESGYSASDAEKIAAIEGADEVSRYLSISVDLKEYEGDSVALTVTENEKVSGFVLKSGEAYDPESTDGIWLSEKYAEKNGIQIGDTLTFSYQILQMKGTVKGLIQSSEYLICTRDETQLMPDYDTYGYAYISPVMFKKAVGMNFYPEIHVLSGLEKKEFAEKADEALGKTALILTKDEVASYAEAEGEATEGKAMGSILPVLFLLIAVLTMVTTMHRLMAKEKTQIGTLKALGYKDRTILLHYSSYAFMIGCVGSVIGIVLGYGIAWYIMNPNGAMGTYFDMPEWKLFMPSFCAAAILLLLIFLTLIGYLSVREMLKGTAADALRPYAPKKMKPMFIERTGLFHRLSFGIRWNLRDTMRHKSRTAMSLLGVVGCMLLLVGALGMKETADEMLITYYEKIAAYSSRIYLTEDASEKKVQEVIDSCDGDWSASVSVQLEEKAVSLDIYGITHDLLHFESESVGMTELPSDGALICERIEKEFGLSVGDTFTVSPYGSDEVYELTVKGINRSLTESISVSEEYAESVGISWSVGSVYTALSKEEVGENSVIKSVQSKEMIVSSYDSFMEIMNIMVAALILGAVLLGIVVLYNLGVMSYTERSREMATLKVLGFKDKKIAGLLISQNIWITLAGIVIGLPAGVGVLQYLIDTLASEYEMKLVVGFLTCSVSILLTFGVSFTVGLMISRKNRKIDMVEALKSPE